MEAIDDLRFLFVTGKGGVGKTTVAAALGLYLAGRGKRVLVAWPDGSLGQRRLWGRQADKEPEVVRENLSIVAIEPYDSMREYAAEVLHSRLLTDRLFDSRLAQGFLRGVPGLQAWAILGKAWFYATGGGEEGPQPDEPPFDAVVFDAPATGHGTDILRVPKIIMDVSPGGRFRRDAEGCMSMLQDPAQTAVLPVTLLEDLPVTETEELLQVVRSDLEIPVGPIIVNQRVEPLFSSQEREVLARKELEAADRRTLSAMRGEVGVAAPDTEETRVRRTLEAAGRRAIREQRSEGFLGRLRELGLPVIQLPELQEPPSDLDSLHVLRRALADGAQGGYRPSSP